MSKKKTQLYDLFTRVYVGTISQQIHGAGALEVAKYLDSNLILVVC
jgi:hypothetical protein